jgi:hypothetical protein
MRGPKVNQLSTRNKVAPATRNGGRRSNGTSGKGRATPTEVASPAGTRVSRVVLRRVDPWSVLKVSVLFYLSVCIVLLTAGVLLWVGARSVGVIENVEGFLDQIGFTDFQFVPGQMLRGAALGGVVLVGTGTFANVLMAVLYNLINDVVGGIRVTLAEDEDVSLRP